MLAKLYSEDTKREPRRIYDS